MMVIKQKLWLNSFIETSCSKMWKKYSSSRYWVRKLNVLVWNRATTEPDTVETTGIRDSKNTTTSVFPWSKPSLGHFTLGGWDIWSVAHRYYSYVFISFIPLDSSSSNLYFLSFVLIFLLELGEPLIRDSKLCDISAK